jgi:AraC-like DNA-binding protein
MDALSDVLKSVRLEGAVFVDAEFTDPWCLQGKFGLARARKRLADAEHVVFFHFLLAGRCKIRLADGGETLEASAGDIVLFPHDDRHVMGSDLRIEPLDTEALARAHDPELNEIRMDGTGAKTRFVCSYLACSSSVNRVLFGSLPRMLRISIGDGPAVVPLRELLRLGVSQTVASQPGAASLLAKLAELLFVEALRRYAETLSAEGRGWLVAARDRSIGHALALLHRGPANGWTVDKLAREVGVSRSALADRFNSLVGESPMQYLKRWRLALAAQTLRASRETILRVAERSGYESEQAFNRAFKREFGMPPAAWRKSKPA